MSSEDAVWRQHTEVITCLIDNRTLVGIDEDAAALHRARESIPAPFPHVLYLLVTDDCNMQCRYCFMRGNEHSSPKHGNMSPATAANVLDYFVSSIQSGSFAEFSSEKQIIFYGGEPLMNMPVLQHVVDYCSVLIGKGELPDNIRFQLVTNGTLLNLKTAQFLKAEGVNVGISIDGDEIITDESRPLKSGGSAYASIVEAIDLCHNLDINVSASVTITPMGLKRKNALLEKMLELKVRSIGFNMLIGKASSQPETYNVEVSQFLLEAFDLFRSKGIYEDRIMRKARSFVEGNLYRFDCAASGANQIVAAPDGGVGICQGFTASREFFYGNVNAGVDYSVRKQVLDEWNCRTPILMDECTDCAALGLCGGGCPYNAYLNAGTIWAKDDRFCSHALETLNWLVWDLYGTTIKAHKT